MKWLLAIAALVIAGVVGAAYMGLLPIPLPLPGVEDKPVGTEVARHVHDGTEYVIVDYEGQLAVFSASGASGAAVSSRSVADSVLLSYSWRKALDGFDSDKLASVARTVRDIDDQVSEVREYTGEVVAIFDELDGMGAHVPLLGRVSAMDAVREYYAGVGEAESLIRSLDSELGSFGDNADALTRASERVEGVQLASVSGAEMERLFADAADAARDLVSTASNLNSKASRARDAAGRLEGAFRDASDTPLIGGAIGGFADSAARLESELSGVQDALGGFESEVAALGRDLRGASESANAARQTDMARWIGSHTMLRGRRRTLRGGRRRLSCRRRLRRWRGLRFRRLRLRRWRRVRRQLRRRLRRFRRLLLRRWRRRLLRPSWRRHPRQQRRRRPFQRLRWHRHQRRQRRLPLPLCLRRHPFRLRRQRLRLRPFQCRRGKSPASLAWGDTTRADCVKTARWSAGGMMNMVSPVRRANASPPLARGALTRAGCGKTARRSAGV